MMPPRPRTLVKFALGLLIPVPLMVGILIALGATNFYVQAVIGAYALGILSEWAWRESE